MALEDTITEASPRPEITRLLVRGVCRGLAEMGFASLTEFSLASGRRADVFALGRRGEMAIIEVKSGLEDYRADGKWPDYRDFCDRFYFAVADDFPREILPVDCGLIAADGFGAVILREAPFHKLNAARRRAVSLQFARAAAERLQRTLDPR